MKEIEMVVSLKVPDTTAITALQTFLKIGFKKITGVKRAEYYKFTIGDDAEKFKEKISKADLLVNANKHSCSFLLPKDHFTNVLVTNIGDDAGSILATLKNRLGFKSIKKMQKSILWSLSIDADEKEAQKIAQKAAQELLANENYQEYEVL